ncbi:MAG: ATP-dependent RNA helicase DbpA, partial [Deltaproteobacteria bacterium]|nr:ATP-dependent RNA helicase DbpA [Deltaproteobacteria bacterium]
MKQSPIPEQPTAADFPSLPLSATLLQVVAELGFTKLTPIQTQGIPLMLQGKDLIAQSTTGSGKTAAFSLPILHGLNLSQRQPQALVLCPTRELCTQVAREIRKLGRRESGLQVLIASGGQPMNPQLAALERGVHVVVGTPGRALDHITRGSLDLTGVRTIVVDEADRMLDMGFGEEMTKILEGARRDRQTAFFSATYPRSIEAMSRAHQRNPVQLTIATFEDAAPQIRQMAYEVEDGRRLDTLLWVLREDPPESAIVFCNLKATVSKVERALSEAGVSTASLHGNLEQKERDFVMAKVRNRSTRVLVATDVAARGLDIDDLDLVVNFEIPFQPEIYVHRIGRTGRAGKAGRAISLVGPQDRHKARAIEKAIKAPLEKQPPIPFDDDGGQAPRAGIPADATMETLYISGGRKDKMRPSDILGALTGESG